MNKDQFLQLLHEQQRSGLSVKAYCQELARPITLGRKNYLFCGNHEAAGWMSVICSLIGTCKEHNVNPRMYLNDVIAKKPYIKTDPLKDPPYDQLLPLLPHVWIISHPEARLDMNQ